MSLDFLKSALTVNGSHMSTEEFLEWLQKRKASIGVKITKIPFSEMSHWYFEDETQNLRHSSGKFFSIEGIEVETNLGVKPRWTQPIINQNEIGYLGILAKKFDGVLHFLMQCKVEPGNINFVQLSPTLQATKSNYSQVHKGNPPLYLEYFLKNNRSKYKVLLDQLQSEQGARFLKKRNRNIILEVFEDIPLEDDFCWLTLGQIHTLLALDNVINMDTRTVISGIPFGSYGDEVIQFYNVISALFSDDTEYQAGMLYSAVENDNHLHSSAEIISWFTELKAQYELTVKRIPLADLDEWTITETEIAHNEGKYFKVIGVESEISNREVSSWTQPIVESVQHGLIAFVVKRINGVYHFLVQAKLEAGNLDVLEMAPTVQCLTGNYRNAGAEFVPPFLDFVLDSIKDSDGILYRSFQSEEGGRFYKEQNENVIIEAPEDFPEDVPENYTWMTLNQLKMFIRFNNYLNIQARSLISVIRFNRHD
jgi:oxidase EvaA